MMLWGCMVSVSSKYIKLYRVVGGSGTPVREADKLSVEPSQAAIGY